MQAIAARVWYRRTKLRVDLPLDFLPISFFARARTPASIL